MAYSVSFKPAALKQFNALDSGVKKRIVATLEKLQTVKQPRDRLLPLTGNLAGYYKLRIGDYRLIFEIVDEKLILIVLTIGHRSKVYK